MHREFWRAAGPPTCLSLLVRIYDLLYETFAYIHGEVAHIGVKFYSVGGPNYETKWLESLVSKIDLTVAHGHFGLRFKHDLTGDAGTNSTDRLQAEARKLFEAATEISTTILSLLGMEAEPRAIKVKELAERARSIAISANDLRERARLQAVGACVTMYKNLRERSDVLLVVTTEREFAQLLLVFPELKVHTQHTDRYVGLADGLSLVAHRLHQPGLVAASVATSTLIAEHAPQAVLVCGICGGFLTTKSDEIALGHIVVPERTWNYSSGKIVPAESDMDRGSNLSFKLEAEPNEEATSHEIIDIARNIDATHRELLELIRIEFLSHACNSTMGLPKGELRIHTGPIASGPVVVDSATYRDEFVKRRKLIAFDMEAHAVVYAAKYMKVPFVGCVKTITDPGFNKEDIHQAYGAYCAARLARELISRMKVAKHIKPIAEHV